MGAAELLDGLRAAGARLAVRAGRVVIVGAPRELRPRLLPMASLIGRLYRDRWRTDLATWPPWRQEAFEGARARRLAAGDTPEAAARWAFLEAAELLAPPAEAPEAPEAFKALDTDPAAVNPLTQPDVDPPPRGTPPEPDAQRWRACLLAWPGVDRSGWWVRYQHHRTAGLSPARAQRRAFLELCEVRLSLGLDVDTPAPELAERPNLAASCLAAYFGEARCRRNHGVFRECFGLVARERDQFGGTRLPPDLRPEVWFVEAAGA